LCRLSVDELLICRPDVLFMETISHFPMVYWLEGTISR